MRIIQSCLFGFLWLFSSLFADYSIVFIHVGDEIPSYADVALAQARLFNPNAAIYLVGSRKGLQRFNALQQEQRIELCSYEDLPLSPLHQQYQRLCAETSPFWRYTSERFLYLWDVIKTYSLQNVFHLENDNMLYADLEPLVPLFQSYYPGIGATFDNEDRCIPGFVWIANGAAMRSLAQYFVARASEKVSDMYVIGSYRKGVGVEKIDRLPIIMPQYGAVYPFQSPSGHTTPGPVFYSNHAEEFSAIFDAAAVGQYLGGIDPMHANNQPGFINESCLFNPSFLQYEWRQDEQGRSVPYAVFQGQSFKLINLHIHSKRLSAFRSD